MNIFVAVVAGLLTAIMLYRFFFRTPDEFINAIKNNFRIGFREDEVKQQLKAEATLWVWLVCSFGVAWCVYSWF